jgi:hypothetical protein
MGSGMTEGCIWLGSARRTGPIAGSTLVVPSGAVRAAGAVPSWRCWWGG